MSAGLVKFEKRILSLMNDCVECRMDGGSDKAQESCDAELIAVLETLQHRHGWEMMMIIRASCISKLGLDKAEYLPKQCLQV